MSISRLTTSHTLRPRKTTRPSTPPLTKAERRRCASCNIPHLPYHTKAIATRIQTIPNNDTHLSHFSPNHHLYSPFSILFYSPSHTALYPFLDIALTLFPNSITHPIPLPSPLLSLSQYCLLNKPANRKLAPPHLFFIFTTRTTPIYRYPCGIQCMHHINPPPPSPPHTTDSSHSYAPSHISLDHLPLFSMFPFQLNPFLLLLFQWSLKTGGTISEHIPMSPLFYYHSSMQESTRTDANNASTKSCSRNTQ